MKLNLIIPTTFGLESVAIEELRKLGYPDLKAENGRIRLEGGIDDIVWCNMNLRTADRVLLEVGNFEAFSFDELFENIKNLPWHLWIPKNGEIHVTGKSIKSQLHSIPDCQAITKKAIVSSLGEYYGINTLPEDGDYYKVEIKLSDNIASVTIDTTGIGLNKRGYRKEGGLAPLRETIAAGICLLSKWKPEKTLVDPFCGSGTFLIEAALIGKNIAPGKFRTFSAEDWSWIPKKLWKDAREKVLDDERDVKLDLIGMDLDPSIIKQAVNNSERAEVISDIRFETKKFDYRDLDFRGMLITNPPYGERIGEIEEAEDIIHDLGQLKKKLGNSQFFILSPHPQFEKIFGRKANKNRKLFNGNIKCYLYSY